MGTIVGSSFRNALCSSFNGVDEHMIGQPNTAMRTATQGAISMWFRIPAVLTANGIQSLQGFGSDGTARINIGIRRIAATGTGTFVSWVYTNNANVTSGYSATTTPLAANTWYHVLFQSNGTAWTCYINGILQTLTSYVAGSTNSGDWFGDMVGANPRYTMGVGYSTGAASTSYFAGRIDEVVCFDRPLTIVEAAYMYGGGSPSNPTYDSDLRSAMLGWWRMGESRDNGTTVFDEISTNDMTLVNMDTSNYVAP